MKIKVSWAEKGWYVIWCLLSLGMIYLLKCIIKIAIAECENSKNV